jgi:hypothetical protein
MRRYPVGLQDFEKIVTEGFIYVDKTKYIFDLTKGGGYYFLSRPRRFGKSMLTTTMQALFEGKKHLFSGLYIADKWDWQTTSPVYRISFADINFEKKGLELAIKDSLLELSKKFNIATEHSEIASLFRELIIKISSTYGKVVVLIDEYDKPIIHYLGVDTQQAIENRNIMKNFYSILKEADPYLKLVFITGISKFTKVSIFSDLNNLADITLDHRYAGICGITQEELESNFEEELKAHDKEKIKQWYNGYTWDMKTWVYNPFSLINFISSGQYQNYWFDSGTPTFLINMLKSNKQYNFVDKEATLTMLSSFDLEKIDALPLMFQTGYLTFTNYDEIGEIYTLNFPNREVERTFNEMLLNVYIENNQSIGGVVMVNKLRIALANEKLDAVKNIINALFKSLPYTLWQNENEAFFHAIMHLTFRLLGIYVQSEVITSEGRIDSIIHYSDKIYCIEIKLDKSAQEALQQINEKGYLTPYKMEGKKMIAIGINFSKEKKEIAELEWEIV